MNKGIARVSKFLQANYESDRTHVSPIPKGHNLPHSGLTSAYDRTNHSPLAPAYPRTHDCGSVQSNAPTREPLNTLSWFAVASPLANENINLPCARRNPSDSLNLALARNGEKLRGVRQPQQFVYLKSTKGDRPSSNYSSRLRRGRRCWISWEGVNERSRSHSARKRRSHPAITAAGCGIFNGV